MVDGKSMTPQAVANLVNRKHGEGTVVLASEAKIRPPRLSTGSLSLDVSLGGGFPANQWTEIVGMEGSGKTTLTMMALAKAQKMDPTFHCVWVAGESYDVDYAGTLGVDNRRVSLIEENVMEPAFDAALSFIANRACDMLVVDSLPSLVPADEDEKTMEEWSPGSAARRINQFMRKCTKASKRSLTDPTDRPFVGIMINQWREKIGVLRGDPRTTPGGKGKNYWMWLRIEAKRDSWLFDEEKNKVGISIKVTPFKTKGARPGNPATVDFYFDDYDDITAGSYDVYKETLDLALVFEVAQRRGNAYVHEGIRYPGGKAGFYDALRADEGLYERVRKEVLDAARGEVEAEAELSVPSRTVMKRR
jgi:recombination protein RecA